MKLTKTKDESGWWLHMDGRVVAKFYNEADVDALMDKCNFNGLSEYD